MRPRILLYLVLLGAAALLGTAAAGFAQGAPDPPPPPPEATSPAAEPAASHARSVPAIHEHGHRSVPPGLPEIPRLRGRGMVGIFTAPEHQFMRNGLAVGHMVGLVCACLGVYIILKRVVFLGLALAEVSSAGVALGLALGFDPMLGSLLLMVAGVVAFSIRWSPRRLSQDTFIGIGFAVASSAALLLVAASPRGEEHMLNLLRGEILTVSTWDVAATAVGLGIVVLVHMLFLKELLFTSFDPETAAAFGYRTRLWEGVLYATVGLAIALGIHTTGVLYTSGCLVIPATGALLLTRRFAKSLVAAAILGIAPVPLGLYVSFVQDVPASAAIVSISFALFAAVAVFAKLTGLRSV